MSDIHSNNNNLEACCSLQPHGLKPNRLLCPWIFPGKNTGVGCHFLLQGIFQTQRLNPHLLYWLVDSLALVPYGKPNLEIINSQMVKNLPAMQETKVWSLGQEDPPEKAIATHSSILAWRIPCRGVWWATVHGNPKELDTIEPLTLSLFSKLTNCYESIDSISAYIL